MMRDVGKLEPRLQEKRIMATAKQELTRLLERQPVDSSFEEIIRELAFSVMVQKGLSDSDAGRTISNEEMRERLSSWRD